jgi:hypothetical protein
MSMSKKDFIVIADAIRTANNAGREQWTFNHNHIAILAAALYRCNSGFKKARWMDYTAGECGSSNRVVIAPAAARKAPRRSPSSELLAKWEHTSEFEALGKKLAMDFDTPSKVSIGVFCGIAGITLKEYDAMMVCRSEQKAAR